MLTATAATPVAGTPPRPATATSTDTPGPSAPDPAWAPSTVEPPGRVSSSRTGDNGTYDCTAAPTPRPAAMGATVATSAATTASTRALFISPSALHCWTLDAPVSNRSSTHACASPECAPPQRSIALTITRPPGLRKTSWLCVPPGHVPSEERVDQTIDVAESAIGLAPHEEIAASADCPCGAVLSQYWAESHGDSSTTCVPPLLTMNRS